MQTIDRPLDLLNEIKVDEKRVSVEMKGNKEPILGKICAFDIHINLVIKTDKGMKFVRGGVIETISPAD
jgi:small nuclear ribonucleoprotein (snRNP)-like protein